MVLSFLLLLLSLVRFSETAIPACFQGWKMNTKSGNSSTSDFPTCGKFVTRNPKGWSDAMTACKAMGSTLFFIKDTDDDDFLTRQFPPNLNDEFWIGLHRNVSTWMWSSGDNFIGLSRFKDQNSVHGCATVDKSGFWIPRNCSEPHPYICKMRATDLLHITQGFLTNVAVRALFTATVGIPSLGALLLSPGNLEDKVVSASFESMVIRVLENDSIVFLLVGNNACPTEEKWVQSLGLCYKVMAGWPDSTWSDARLHCKALQADLAVYNDHDNPLTRSPFLVSHLNLTEHWIGMRYNTTLRNFTWLDGDTVSFVNATVGGPDATCGAVSVSSGGLILPKRDDCNKKKSFICELAFFEVVSTTAPTVSSTENTQKFTTTSSRSAKTSPSSITPPFISDATSSLIVTSPSVSTLKVSSFSSTVTQPMVAPTLHPAASSNSSNTGASILLASPFSNGGNNFSRRSFPDADFTAGSARNDVFYSCNHQISQTSICSQNNQNPGGISQSSDRGNPTNRNAHVSGGTKGTPMTHKPTSLTTLLKTANIIKTTTEFITPNSFILTTVRQLLLPHNLTSNSNSNNGANDTLLTTNTNGNSFPHSDYVTAYASEDHDSSSDDQSNFSITTSALHPTLTLNEALLTPLANGNIYTNVTTQLPQASAITASVTLSQNATSSPNITTVHDSSSSVTIHDFAGGSTAVVLPTLDHDGNSSNPIYVPDPSLKSPTEKFQRCLTLGPSLKLSCLHQEIFPFERLCGKDQAFSDYVDELTNSSSYVNETVEAFADVVNDLLQPSVFDELPCIPTTVFSKLSGTIERMMANVGNTVFSYTLPKLEVFMSSQSPQSITSFQYEGSFPNTIVNILSFKENSPPARIGEKIQVSILMLNTMYSSSKVNFSNSNGKLETVYLVSPVMCLSAYSTTRRYSMTNSFQLPHLSKSSLIHKEKLNKGVMNYLCAFYKPEEGTWSTEGCSVVSTDDLKTTCYCDHTTSFAILMQITDVEIPKEHELALSVITYIGCSVSLISMFIAVTVFTCVQSLNSERVAVHRNLCIAIGLAQVAFLAGIKATQHQLVCRVVALILHYSYTAVFIWMLVEGLHLYTKVVQVFGTEKSRIAYYLSFGWGVPLVLVTISAVADWEGYGTPTSCWLSIKRSTIWAFVGPAIAVIIVNVVILILVIRIVISSAKLDSRGEFDHIKAGIKGALFLLPLLGLTWIFGLLCVNKELMVFQYFFAAFNSLQGFFIFLFHCALNSEVRQALKRMRDRHLLQRGDVITNSTTSSAPDLYGRSSPPYAGDARYASKYVDTFKIYQPLHMPKGERLLPGPPNSGKSERTESQNSGRTRDTVLSRHGQSPDMLLPNDQLALIYI